LVDEFLVLNPPDEIIYRIATDGSRTCIERMWPCEPGLPDPLGERDVSSVYDFWGKPPGAEEDPEGYAVLAGTNLGVGPSGENNYPTSVWITGR